MTKTMTAAAVLEGQMTFDELDGARGDAGTETAAAIPEGALPQPWDHPEFGRYYIVPAGAARGDFENLYYDMLFRLVRRKWDELFMGGPYPEIRRAELVNQADLENPGQFAPVQGVVIRLAEKPWNAMFIRPGRLEQSLAKNLCACLKLDDRTYAISPFFGWEEADFWEKNLYALD